MLTQRHAYSRWQKAPKKISCSDANSGCCGLTRLLYIISTSKFSNVSLNQLASFLYVFVKDQIEIAVVNHRMVHGDEQSDGGESEGRTSQ